MSKRGFDQAEGLRRLLVRPLLRVITVVGARQGLGATSVVVNLAASLVSAGKKVLVLDENLAHDNVANTLALKPRYDLLNTVRDNMSWREVMMHTSTGVNVLPVARAMQTLPSLNEAERERLLENLNAASWGMDVVLVDASTDGHSVCASLSGDEPLLLVLNATAEGIKESYTLLKQMSVQHGRQAFDLVVNKTRNEQEAHIVFDNMSKVSRQHLPVKLNYLGNIPMDSFMEHAAQLGRPIVDTYPQSPASLAFDDLVHNLLLLPAVEHEGSNALSQLMQRLFLQKSTHRVVHANR